MDEMEPFEIRLASSLLRLADEVPTEVDGWDVARTVSSAGTRSGWWSALAGARTIARLRLGRTMAVALALLLIAALLLGMLALAQRIEPVPFGDAWTGRMTCAGSSWTASSSALVLDCSTVTAEPRFSGTVRLDLGAPSGQAASAAWAGSIELRTAGATWTGAVFLVVGPNGVVTGDATLVGQGPQAREAINLRLISNDGVRWGLLGSTVAVG